MAAQKGVCVDGIFIPETTDKEREEIFRAVTIAKNDPAYLEGKLPKPDETAKEKVCKVLDIADESTGTLDDLNKSASRLDDINSSFPATRAFLQKKGLTNVSQLDEQGRTDLMAFLSRALEQYRNRSE